MFERVASLENFWDGEKMGVRVRSGKRVLLVKVEGHVRAYEDRCPHLGVALSEGRLDGCELTCRAHEWKFNVLTGQAVNPAGATLRELAIKIENGEIFVSVDVDVDVDADTEVVHPPVGPVLQAGAEMTEAIVAVLLESNAGAKVIDRGSYLRVMAPGECRLKAKAVERLTGRVFHLPGDLEALMPSFKGKLVIMDDEAVWSAPRAAAPEGGGQ